MEYMKYEAWFTRNIWNMKRDSYEIYEIWSVTHMKYMKYEAWFIWKICHMTHSYETQVIHNSFISGGGGDLYEWVTCHIW